MILGLEIGLLIYGIIVLSRGRMNASKTKAVYGGRARLLGVLCLLPLPIAFGIGAVVGVSAATSGRRLDAVMLAGIEVAVVLGIALLVAILGMIWAEPLRQDPAAPSGPQSYGFPMQPLAPPPPPVASAPQPPIDPTQGR